ncbi:GAF domain-containing DNA-binding protein [Hymenobacter antarcticus]|uniref:HTH LytTR-type domain-containing protein n=1 Tax=Hymenobacter antarcticus TaxID=486270 RepID=A0ABP7NZL9_9BACT
MKHPKRPAQTLPVLPQANEPERLRVLRSYEVIDTDPEQVFNDLVHLAAFICGTPISLIFLVDDKRQWFKARVGLEPMQMPREDAFCQYAMLAADVCEVPDATVDVRFAHNSLVTGDSHVRFYAGAPLLSPEGQPIGTLCALDTVPRHLTPDQREALRVLARQVMVHLELHHMQRQVENERQTLDGVLRMVNSNSEAPHTNSRSEIFVKQEQRLVRVATADLQYVEALGDYVNLHTTRERLTVYGTMKDLEAKLPSHDFARVHRKYIVRLDRIIAIENDAATLDSSLPAPQSRTPVRVPIGSSYKAGLLARLNVV